MLLILYCTHCHIRLIIPIVFIGDMDILFRTNEAGRYSGFEGIVICFDQSLANQPGCTRPEINSRRKRSTGVSIFCRLPKDSSCVHSTNFIVFIQQISVCNITSFMSYKYKRAIQCQVWGGQVIWQYWHMLENYWSNHLTMVLRYGFTKLIFQSLIFFFDCY